MFFKVKFFAELKIEVINAICERLNYVTFKQGEYLTKEGEAGNKMYIIISGTAQVFKLKIN